MVSLSTLAHLNAVWTWKATAVQPFGTNKGLWNISNIQFSQTTTSTLTPVSVDVSRGVIVVKPLFHPLSPPLMLLSLSAAQAIKHWPESCWSRGTKPSSFISAPGQLHWKQRGSLRNTQSHPTLRAPLQMSCYISSRVSAKGQLAF